MNKFTHKAIALATISALGAFSAVSSSAAQEAINTSVHGVFDPGAVEILTNEQISAEEWTFRFQVNNTGMDRGRYKVIQGAAEFVAAVLNQDIDSPQHEIIKKILIIDEKYDVEMRSYEAFLRVHSAIEDPGYNLTASRNANFESDGVKTAPPAWVLLVPAVIENEAWDLSSKKSPWSSKWKIPFRDGATQFVPATIDADDMSMMEAAENLTEVADHLGRRYNAPAVLFVARSDDDKLSLSYFKPDATTGRTLSITGSTKTALADIRQTRAATIETFWGLHEELHTATKFAGEPVRYRFVGRPRLDVGPTILTMQIIAARTTGLDDILERLKELEGATILRYTDHGSSYLVTLDYEGSPNLELQLEALNFTGSLF